MTGRHVTRDEASPCSLGAEDSTAAGRQLEADLARLTLIRASRDLGTTWAAIGSTQGKPPKIAKRDAKRLHAATRRAWYLQANQQTAADGPPQGAHSSR